MGESHQLTSGLQGSKQYAVILPPPNVRKERERETVVEGKVLGLSLLDYVYPTFSSCSFTVDQTIAILHCIFCFRLVRALGRRTRLKPSSIPHKGAFSSLSSFSIDLGRLCRGSRSRSDKKVTTTSGDGA